MKKQQIIIGIVVGYMLKVMKAFKTKTLFKKEFTCIRHGNYPEFISIVNGSVPEMVVYKSGNIEVNPNPKEDNFDFIGLVMAGPSMKEFYEKCVKEYGVFIDKDVSDEIYYKIAIYEITIRIHANKFQTIDKNDTLQTIISNLGEYLRLTNEEVETIQKGRRLLNMIKHGAKSYSWYEESRVFKKAFQLMKEKRITLK